MRKMKNWKMRQKFLATIGFIAVMVFILVGFFFSGFLKMSSMVESFGDVQYVNMNAQMSMRKDIQTINKRLLLTIYVSDQNKPEDTKADFDERFEEMQGNITTIGKTLNNDELISTLQEEFEQLKKCDGLCDLEETQLTRSLLEKQWIRPAKEGETTDPYLLHRSYDNRYVLNMGINITERCNFNCLHCYEAVDNEILREEMSLENCRKLLEEAASCGIQNIKITGGEPLMHPDFMEIVRCVYQNDMTVDRINTNGFFLTPELLDELRSLDPHILFNISYDGAGYHDWMRGRKGAEDDLLKKIRLLVDKGFQVRAAMTLNRVNRDAAAQTMNRMEAWRTGVSHHTYFRDTPLGSECRRRLHDNGGIL